METEESMIIRYRNGKTIEGAALYKTANTIRLAVKGLDDAVELERVNGRWITADCEPVEVEMSPRKPEPSRLDCDYICPPGLAARLIQMLREGTDEEEPAADWLMQRAPDETKPCRVA